jgi:hypothetical protein
MISETPRGHNLPWSVGPDPLLTIAHLRDPRYTQVGDSGNSSGLFFYSPIGIERGKRERKTEWLGGLQRGTTLELDGARIEEKRGAPPIR